MPHGEIYKKLDELAEIRTGVTFKHSIDNKPGGDMAVLLPRDISNGCLIADPPIVNSNEIRLLENHLLKNGDILIANKGTKFGSFLYEDFPQPAIAASSFFVITPNNSLLRPEFLFWFLNQPAAKDFFSKRTFGSTIPSITKNTVASLPVPVPPIAEQHRLTSFIAEIQREQLLLKDLLEKRKRFGDSYVWEHILTQNP